MRMSTVGCVTMPVTFWLAGCVHLPPREIAAPREAVVQAPIDRVSESAIGVLQERQSRVVARDREAGVILAERDSLPEIKGVADCGRALGVTLPPTAARYGVKLQGDSVRTVVTVSATWIFGLLNDGRQRPCGSTGAWEAEVVAAIKERAEANRR